MSQWKKTEPVASLDGFYDVDLKPAPDPPKTTVIPRSDTVPYPKDILYDPQKRNWEEGYEYFTEYEKGHFSDMVHAYYRVNGGEKIRIHELSSYSPRFMNIYKGNLYFCSHNSVFRYSEGSISNVMNLGSSHEIKDMFCFRDLFILLVHVDNADHSQYSPYLSTSEYKELHEQDLAFLATYRIDGEKIKEIKSAHGSDCLLKP